MRLPEDPGDDEILRAVEDWIDDLARGDYESAFSRTGHDRYYGWTPKLMQAVVEGYGHPEPDPRGAFRVTSRCMAQGRPAQRQVERHNLPRGAIAEVRYDLPLNGEWSDLTATFRVEPRAEGTELVLEEIHVF
jgi:hypothetical protein